MKTLQEFIKMMLNHGGSYLELATHKINPIKDCTPNTHFKTFQQLTLSAIIDKHVGDLNITNQKADRFIDIVLCQAPHVDPITVAYQEHVKLAKLGGKYVFNTHDVLTHISTYTLINGTRKINSQNERCPAGNRTLPLELSPQAILNPEFLPIENCFDVKIPHPKPTFWCNKLELPQERRTPV